MAVTRSAAKTATAPVRENPLNLFVWEGTDKRGVKMKGEQSSKNANFLRAELRRQGITPTVVKAVLAQDPAALFQNDQGVMFGNGEVWAAEMCAHNGQPPCPLRVITVNRPAR